MERRRGNFLKIKSSTLSTMRTCESKKKKFSFLIICISFLFLTRLEESLLRWDCYLSKHAKGEWNWIRSETAQLKFMFAFIPSFWHEISNLKGCLKGVDKFQLNDLRWFFLLRKSCEPKMKKFITNDLWHANVEQKISLALLYLQ